MVSVVYIGRWRYKKNRKNLSDTHKLNTRSDSSSASICDVGGTVLLIYTMSMNWKGQESDEQKD